MSGLLASSFHHHGAKVGDNSVGDLLKDIKADFLCVREY